MNRIKELRILKGLTQQQLAELINVKRPVISKYENGTIALTDSLIIKLSEVFEVNADYLLGRTDDPTPIEIQKPIPNDEDELSPKVREFVQRFQDAGIDLKSMDEADMNKIIALAKIANGK